MHVLGPIGTNLSKIGSLQVQFLILQNYAEPELSRRAWGFKPRWARVFVVKFYVLLAHAEREPKCHAERACLKLKWFESWTRVERGIYSTLSVGMRWSRFCVLLTLSVAQNVTPSASPTQAKNLKFYARAERGVLSHAERGCALGQVLCVAHAERGTKCHAEREPCANQNLGFSRSRWAWIFRAALSANSLEWNFNLVFILILMFSLGGWDTY